MPKQRKHPAPKPLPDRSLAPQPPARQGFLRNRPLWVVLATVIAFAPVAWNEFVDWDDLDFIVRNEAFRGLSWKHWQWMFTTTRGGHYQPLTWLSWAIESKLWGVTPTAFHLTNLAIHIATAVIFFFVARRLIVSAFGTHSKDTEFGALAATLLFSIHPLRVESVAWATERRDVLSGLFLVLTVLCYLRATQTPEPRALARAILTPSTTARLGEALGAATWFGIAVLSYVLSLLSKATGMTIPMILLLMDAYPMRRFQTVSVIRLLYEKILFLIPAAIAAAAAVWAQSESGALRTWDQHSLGLRIAQALYGVVFYPWKTLLPTGLIPLYEQRPEAMPLDWQHVFSGILVVGITFVALSLRKRWPSFLFTWIAYIILLSPMLGLAQSGPQVVADRYSYIACLPWAVLLGGVVERFWRSMRSTSRARFAFIVGSMAILSCLVILTQRQTRVWADSFTLWTTTIDRAPRNGTAYAGLANLHNSRGEFQKARERAQTALNILPGNRSAHVAMARSSLELGEFALAEKHYEIAVEIYEKVGKSDPAALGNLAIAKTELGKTDEAERIYGNLVEIEPNNTIWSYNLASLLANRGKLAEAKDLFQRSVAIQPNDADARFRLSVVLMSLGDVAAAIQSLEEGLRHAPNNVAVLSRLAWILATTRDSGAVNPTRSLELAQRAVSASGSRDPSARESLAAALAATGDFEAAVATLRTVLADPTLSLSETARHRMNENRKLFELRRPIRE